MLQIRELPDPAFYTLRRRQFHFTTPRLVVAIVVQRETEFYEVFPSPEGNYQRWRTAVEETANGLGGEVDSMKLYTREGVGQDWTNEDVTMEQLDGLPVE